MPRSEYLPLNTQRQALLLGIIVKVIKSNVLHDEFSLVVGMRTCAAHLSLTIPLLLAITTTFQFGIFLPNSSTFTRNLHFTSQLSPLKSLLRLSLATSKIIIMKLLVPFLVATTVLAGCAGKPDHRDKGEVFFETKINPDGTKLFAFSIGMPSRGDRDEGHGPRPSRGGNGGGRGGRDGGGDVGGEARGGNDRDAERMEAFYDTLSEKLFETQYCRNGYIEIDTHETEGRYHLLGECQESASEEDKLKFANPY